MHVLALVIDWKSGYFFDFTLLQESIKMKTFHTTGPLNQ